MAEPSSPKGLGASHKKWLGVAVGLVAVSTGVMVWRAKQAADKDARLRAQARGAFGELVVCMGGDKPPSSAEAWKSFLRKRRRGELAAEWPKGCEPSLARFYEAIASLKNEAPMKASLVAQVGCGPHGCKLGPSGSGFLTLWQRAHSQWQPKPLPKAKHPPKLGAAPKYQARDLPAITSAQILIQGKHTLASGQSLLLISQAEGGGPLMCKLSGKELATCKAPPKQLGHGLPKLGGSAYQPLLYGSGRGNERDAWDVAKDAAVSAYISRPGDALVTGFAVEPALKGGGREVVYAEKGKAAKRKGFETSELAAKNQVIGRWLLTPVLDPDVGKVRVDVQALSPKGKIVGKARSLGSMDRAHAAEVCVNPEHRAVAVYLARDLRASRMAFETEDGWTPLMGINAGDLKPVKPPRVSKAKKSTAKTSANAKAAARFGTIGLLKGLTSPPTSSAWGSESGSSNAGSSPKSKKRASAKNRALLRSLYGRGNGAGRPHQLTCRAKRADLTWRTASRVSWLSCTPAGCRLRERSFPQAPGGRWWLSHPIGDKFALVWRSGLGIWQSVVADWAELSKQAPVDLFETPDYGGPVVQKPLALPFADGAWLLFQGGGLRGLRLSPDRSFAVLHAP